MAFDLESSRHFPGAVALEYRRIGGRRTECARYFVFKMSGIGRKLTARSILIVFKAEILRFSWHKSCVAFPPRVISATP